MLRIQLTAFFLLALIATTGAQEDAEKITFKKKAITKGYAISMAQKVTIKINVNITAAEQPSMTQKTNEQIREVRKYSILETGPKGPSKVRIDFMTFESKATTEAMGNVDERENDSPLTGNSYVVTLSDGVLDMKSAEGEDVPADQLEKLTKELGSDYKRRGNLFDVYQHLDTVVGEKSYAVGEKITVPKEQAKYMFGADTAEMGIDKVELTLTGTRTYLGTKCAVFSLSAKLEFPSQPGAPAPSAELSGELLVGIDNLWGYGVNVNGPISMSMTTPQVSVEGSGMLKMSLDSGFIAPKK